MNIIWDQIKNEWLIINRGISFDEISDIILNDDYLDVIINPTRDNQQYFIMNINNYTWVVPFLFDDSNQIVLKTAFPSRKMHKVYGGYDENI